MGVGNGPILTWPAPTHDEEIMIFSCFTTHLSNKIVTKGLLCDITPIPSSKNDLFVLGRKLCSNYPQATWWECR